MNNGKALFPGASGEPLAGRLELPTGPVAATALFAHCFTLRQGLGRRLKDLP